MFCRSGIIYTVHEKADAPEPSDRIVLVREGFAFWALIFGLLWLLAHRCWRMSGIFFLMLVLLGQGGSALGLNHAAQLVLQLGLQYWLACTGNDWRRASLARSGYTEIDVVTAESELLAERRYFDKQLHRLHSSHPAV